MVTMIDRTRPEPIYRQIRDWMRQQITSGLWPEHYKLKPETELIEDLGVSRGTLRKAASRPWQYQAVTSSPKAAAAPFIA